MSFVSYAQNFEDVMLWRALKHIEKGFYVDIGAQDPVVDSVSLAFYEHGWRGVHVEPTQQYSSKLRAARPDERVLQVAIGNQAGTLSFYEFQDTGLSTADTDIARSHQEAGFRCNETQVPVISLDALFKRIGVEDIHWLKLDVEGFEKAVIESWVDSSILPWVLVIESTRPLTQEQSHGEWEPLLLNKGYRYVYFDGLNRFYVSPHHAELAGTFRSPPNVFDGFVLSGIASQPFYRLVETKAQQAEAKAQQAEAKAQQAEVASNERLAQLQAVYASTSWKITRPLRGIKRLLSDDFSVLGQSTAALKLKAKQALRPLVVKGITYVNARPTLRNRLKRLITHFPWLRQKMIRIALNSHGNAVGGFAGQRAVPLELQNMTPRARRIYQDLKTAIDDKKRGAA